jgi:hypothetical protein
MELAKIDDAIEAATPAATKVVDSQQIVYLLCLDNRSLCRVNKNGRLFADLPEGSGHRSAEYEFRLFKVPNNDRVAFKSVAYNKFLSKGSAFPRFRFQPREEADEVSAHQLFVQAGEFLMVCRHLHQPKYLNVSDDNQVFPDGSKKRKARIITVPVETYKKKAAPSSGPLVQLTGADMSMRHLDLATDSTMMPAPASAPIPEKKSGSNIVPPASRLSLSSPAVQGLDPEDPNEPLAFISPRKRNSLKSPSIPQRPPGEMSFEERERLTSPSAIQKFNSTSSLYIKDTIADPNLDELLWCMACALAKIIQLGVDTAKKTFIDIFDERIFPLQVKSAKKKENEKDYDVLTHIPKEDEVFLFIQPIFHKLRVKPESGVLSLYYIEKMIRKTSFTFAPFNWRKVVLACVILATKVYEELAVWNADFKEVFPNLSVHDLNKMEMELLRLLDFEVGLNSAKYVKYFFAIRDHSELDTAQFPIKPLDKKALVRLEESSKSAERKARKARLGLSVSTSELSMPPSSPFVVLS